MKDIVEYTKERSEELAEYLVCIAATPLIFEGDQPLAHSSNNHINLWKLEYLADSNAWIDTDYKTEFIKYIFEQWRRRLKGISRYRERGYRMYVYEDMAPTISVVAETDTGFPYSHRRATFVQSIREVVKCYEGRSWKANFGGLMWEITQEKMLKEIDHRLGSIGTPTASALGMKVGKLRNLIINMGVGDEVNKIRKKHKRRPADFTNEFSPSEEWHVFERCLPAHYE